MAKATLANHPKPHQLLADVVRPFVPQSHPKSQSAFRVFPTGEAEFHWRIAALATNRTISRHKSLTFAIRKCARLNKQCSEGARNETN